MVLLVLTPLLLRFGYVLAISTGLAGIVTGFISVFKSVINIKSINSFNDLTTINNSAFDIYYKPLTSLFLISLISIILILHFMRKGHLVKKYMPF